MLPGSEGWTIASQRERRDCVMWVRLARLLGRGRRCAVRKLVRGCWVGLVGGLEVVGFDEG